MSALCLRACGLCRCAAAAGVTGLKADRADIIVAGVIVVEELMTLGGFEALVVCTRGVRGRAAPARDVRREIGEP